MLGWIEQLNSYEYPDTYFEVYKRPITIEQKIIKAFPEHPELMLAIADCESGLRQFDNKGNYIKSHTNDSGLFQINDKVWFDTAKELGLDYKWNVDDNIKMAQYVYSRQGLGAWVCHDIVAYNY